MKTGQIISVNTHAEFLNRLLHLQYKQYMKCTYDLGDGDTVWMIRLDGKKSSTGWINVATNGNNTIVEQYVGNAANKLPTHWIFPNERRVIFDIRETSYSRAYVFMGVFSLDAKSSNNCRIWNKVSDTYQF